MSATFQVGIGADITGLSSGLKNAENQISSFVSKVNKIGELGDVFQNVGAKLTAGLTLPILGLGTAAIKSFGDIQSLQKGLEAVMGSASAANGEFNKLKEVAKLPGLGLEEAVKGSINLQAIGMSADNSRNILLQFGNAVASVGKGRAEFERAIYGVQQLANTDFPLGEDLNIIKDALPQVSNLLKDAFGTSRSDELAKMGISSQQVLDVITNGLEKLPRVSGGIKGAFENLSDSMKTSLGRIGAIIDKNLNITELVDKISSGLNTVITWFENLNPSIQTGILAFAGLAAAIGPVLVVVGGFMSMLPTIMTGIGAISTLLTALTGPIGLVVVGVGAIVAVFVTQWSKIKPIILNTINYFVDLYNESLVFRGSIEYIILVFKSLFTVVKGVLSFIWDNVKTVAKGIIGAFSAVGKAVKGALTGDLDLIAQSFNDFNNNLATTGLSIANNAKKSFDGIFNGLKGNFNDFLNKTLSSGKAARVTDIGVSIPGLSEAVKNEADKQIVDGLGKAGKDKGKNKVEVTEFELLPLGVGKAEDIYKSVGDSQIAEDVSTKSFIEQLRSNTLALTQEIASRKSALQLSIEEMNASINESFAQITSDFAVSSIQNVFGSIGEAIANGGNVLGAIGKSLLQSFGGFLSSMGDMLIKYGTLAILKGKLDIAIASGGPFAIAAGIAAVAVGALLKVAGAAIGASANKGFSSSGGGSVSSNTGSSVNSYSSSVSSSGGNGGEYVFVINGYDLVSVYDKNKERLTRLGG